MKQRPALVLKGMALSIATLFAEAAVLALSDMGGPAWVLVPLLAWLLTLGLPTTATTVALAALWGRVPQLTGLGGFVITAAVVGAVSHCAALRWLATRGGGRK